jgi:acyl-CoA thioester hydrolase
MRIDSVAAKAVIHFTDLPQRRYPGARSSVIDVYVNRAIPHFFSIGIDPGDIDFMGHVNNASYLKWVQEAVLDHWRALAPADAIGQHLWVALKHEITYRKPAFLEDDVIATVLLEKVQGARAFYETVIRRGEEVLAEVKSSWCCLDADTMRPARIAREVMQRFFSTDDTIEA